MNIHKTSYRNLFEYLHSTTTHGTEGNLIFCLSKIFGVEEFKINEDYNQLLELVEAETQFINRTQLSENGKRKL